MMKKNDNKGFSLIELIIAVTILAIISATSIMAFGGIFSTKVTAVSKSIQDALKQARIDALGLENINDTGTTYKTTIYAKFYCDDGFMYVDVCSLKPGEEESNEKILHSTKLSNDSYNLEFWNEGAAETDPKVSIREGSSNVVKIYFKKSTGGIRGVDFTGALPADNSGINYIKVVGPGNDNTETVYMVKVTGRCYIDS